MNRIPGIILIAAMAAATAIASAEEPPAERIDLKDGSTLFLHPDGTGRMVDEHGKPMRMDDGVPMETADGRTIMMKNKWVWVRLGPPGKVIGEVKRPD